MPEAVPMQTIIRITIIIYINANNLSIIVSPAITEMNAAGMPSMDVIHAGTTTLFTRIFLSISSPSNKIMHFIHS